MPAEQKRLIAAGARVAPWEGDAHHPVFRVWRGREETPGIAISRSLGDSIATEIGVIPTPDVISRELTPDVRFVILASDGVWEFVGSLEAVLIVGRALESGTAADATHELIVEASRRWEAHEDVTDDITAIVVQLSGGGRGDVQRL